MKIAFVCSCLEPGRDGVGDYTRRLASELIRQGHPCVAIALNDPHISKIMIEQQEMEGATIPVLRLPSFLLWEKRIGEARNWLAAFHPDWLSLQFVPFGYHPKGLCFGLGKSLAALNTKASWHIMFHELWLGLGENASLKHRVWGGLQRWIILDFMGRLRPRLIHTQTESYRIALGWRNIIAAILPLFSNIPRTEGNCWSNLLEPLVSNALGKAEDRNKLYLAGILGGVHPEWVAADAVNLLLPLTQRFQKRLVLVFLGKNNVPPEVFDQLKLALQGRADVVVAGERSNAEISQLLQALDFGLATSPLQIIHKSGSVAAMVEHGLQILVTRDDWRLRGLESPLEEKSPRLLTPKQFAALKTLPMRDPQPPADCGVKRVADRMLSVMKAPLSAFAQPEP